MIANGTQPEAKVSKVTIEFNQETGAFRWTVAGPIPTGALANTLGIMKLQLELQQLTELQKAQQQAARSGIVMPDGSRPPFQA